VHCCQRITQRFNAKAEIGVELLADLEVFSWNEGPERFDGTDQIA
jgi:hypothetical protein